MSDFSRVINGELKKFNDPESDKMHRLKGEISEVKDVMRSNINKVLELRFFGTLGLSAFGFLEF